MLHSPRGAKPARIGKRCRLEVLTIHALHIEQFGSQQLAEGAGLFAATYRDLLGHVPVMPAQYADPQAVTPLIDRLHRHYPMVAAMQDGRLVGYLGGMLLPELKGRDRGVFCPEWGHAVSPALPPGERRSIYRRMYQAIGEIWVGDGRLNHAISVLAHDRDALDTWFWTTFGLLVVDMVRDLTPIAPDHASDGGVRIHPAGVEEAARLLPAFAEHVAYYRRAPIWLPKPLVADASEVAAELADPKSVVWVADDVATGDVLGIMKHTVESDDACTVVRDETTVACTGAYVLPASRGRGVGTMLLNAIMGWGRENGYTRLSLDFEAANILGRGFWLRHLTPVVYSVFRHVNDHMLDVAPQA